MTDLRPIYFNEARARLVGNECEVYTALASAGPSTCKELAARMGGWDVTSVRPRVSELRKAGRVEKTGIRRNGEHEFQALTAAQMQAGHEAEHAEPAEVTVERARALYKTTAGTFRELKQMEIFA